MNSVKAYGWYKSGWFFWETTNPSRGKRTTENPSRSTACASASLWWKRPIPRGDNLSKGATDELKKYSGFTGSVQINAADLCDIGVDTDRLDFMKETYVLSEPHGIDDWLPCTKEVIPLHELDQKDFTFGATTAKLSSCRRATLRRQARRGTRSVHHWIHQQVRRINVPFSYYKCRRQLH